MLVLGEMDSTIFITMTVATVAALMLSVPFVVLSAIALTRYVIITNNNLMS